MASSAQRCFGNCPHVPLLLQIHCLHATRHEPFLALSERMVTRHPFRRTRSILSPGVGEGRRNCSVQLGPDSTKRCSVIMCKLDL